MNFDIEKLNANMEQKYEQKWGNILIRGKYYDIPALPLGVQIPWRKWIVGKWRMLFNRCPKCNSSAPELDTCTVCEGYRMIGYPLEKEKKEETNLLLWNRYMYELMDK